jgi:hypothetical protein
MTVLKEADETITRRVTAGFREGIETLELGTYDRDLGSGREVQLDELITVLAEAQTRFSTPSQSDSWLGPRLHAALRLTRREAASSGVWRWLGLGIGAEYIRWRWAKRDLSRFVGSYYLHGLGRLWWMSELFRNGPDYGPAAEALLNQDIPQNFLRMDIAHHRPTCQGFLRVDSKRKAGGRLTGREANALAKAANCAATTVMFEAIAPDVTLDADAQLAWATSEIDIAQFFDDLPLGPDDPPVPEESLVRMMELLTEVFTEAPVRGGTEDEEEEESAEPAA